jgi:4-alpha-glucanotransferase
MEARNLDHEVRAAARERGVATHYFDVGGREIEVPVDTLRHVLDVLGPPPAPDAPPVYVLREGQEPWRHDLPEDAVVHLDQGGTRALPAELPGSLPIGRHVLELAGRTVPLLVAPRTAHPPADRREWGLAVQLYALRSGRCWGIGDLGDLAQLPAAAGWPGFVLLSPLHAPVLAAPVQPSPYYATSRRVRNPLHLAVEAVPEAAALDGAGREAFAALAAEGRALTARPLIDRDAVLAVKEAALRLAFGAVERLDGRAAALAAHRAAQPDADRFAAFTVLARRHGGDFRRWPAPFRDVAGAGVARLVAGEAGEIAFHAWLQLLMDEQLAAVPAMRLGVIADLAVGTAPGGYDHWLRPAAVADRLSVGAPPDPLGPHGQDWGLPPTLPEALTADGYAGFAGDLAANMRHAGGLRIDHVMGLFRLFVMPAGASPSEGTYLTYPARDLLATVALESRRAACVVIGEDLGTVAAGVREALADHGILGYRVAWFEDGPAESFPRLAMAAVTTHDLPTVAGAYGGDPGDLDLERLARVVADRDPVLALHEHVAATPALLACAALDDVVGATARPNTPGTVDEFPNWRVQLPEPVEQLPDDPRARAVLRAIATGREEPGGPRRTSP